MLANLFLLIVAAEGVLSCARHDNHQRHPHLGKRQTIVTDPGRTQTDWRYEASFNWGLLNPGIFFFSGPIAAQCHPQILIASCH